MIAYDEIVILYFALTPELQLSEKPLLFKKPTKGGLTALKKLDTYHKNTLQNTGYKWVWVNENAQGGDSFGERLANAHQVLFDQGYAAIITIGNDALSIDHINWDSVVQQVSQGKTILGPDRRGGAYLITTHRHQFNYDQFKDVEWQSASCFESLIHFFDSSLVCLQKVYDYNEYADLLHAYGSKQMDKGLIHILYHIIIWPVLIRFHYTEWIKTTFNTTFKLRGPPMPA